MSEFLISGSGLGTPLKMHQHEHKQAYAGFYVFHVYMNVVLSIYLNVFK